MGAHGIGEPEGLIRLVLQYKYHDAQFRMPNIQDAEGLHFGGHHGVGRWRRRGSLSGHGLANSGLDGLRHHGLEIFRRHSLVHCGCDG